MSAPKEDTFPVGSIVSLQFRIVAHASDGTPIISHVDKDGKETGWTANRIILTTKNATVTG